MKITLRKIIIASALLAIVGFVIYRSFFVTKAPKYVLTDVRRGSIAEYVTETGSAAASRELNLNFKSVGKVAEVLVKEGDEVKTGTPLMKLDVRELQTRRRSAVSALASVEAKYAQALAGASNEDLKVAEAAVLGAEAKVASAEQALASARLALENTKVTGNASVSAAEISLRGSLESLYLESQSAMQSLEKDAYELNGSLKSDLLPRDNTQAAQSASAYAVASSSYDQMIDDIQLARTAIGLSALDPVVGKLLEEGRNIRTSTQLANALLQDAKPTAGLTTAALDIRRTDMAAAWSSMNVALNTAETQRSAAVSASASAAASRSTAEAAVSAAEKTAAEVVANLNAAKAQLSLKKAPLREVDRAVYQAGVAAAQADLATIDQQISDAVILAPEDGVVGTLDIKVGELATGAGRAVSLISTHREITADVSELDIGKIAVGSAATISFDALGGESYGAKVTKIAPRETSKDSDIFYITTLVLDDANVLLRPGMTADISILVGQKDDVLLVPKRLVIKRNNKDFIKILKNNDAVEVPVRVGLEGDDDVEILEGLTTDDKLISG